MYIGLLPSFVLNIFFCPRCCFGYPSLQGININNYIRIGFRTIIYDYGSTFTFKSLCLLLFFNCFCYTFKYSLIFIFIFIYIFHFIYVFVYVFIYVYVPYENLQYLELCASTRHMKGKFLLSLFTFTVSFTFK